MQVLRSWFGSSGRRLMADEGTRHRKKQPLSTAGGGRPLLDLRHVFQHNAWYLRVLEILGNGKGLTVARVGLYFRGKNDQFNLPEKAKTAVRSLEYQRNRFQKRKRS